MKSVFAASAVVALAGSSYGFVVSSLAVQPGEQFAPSSGAFFNTYSGTYLSAGKGLITGDGKYWSAYGDYIRGTSFLAIDRAGGASGFSLEATGKGVDPGIFIPEFNAGTGNELFAGTGGVNVGFLNDGSAFLGGASGYTWSASAADSFNAPSSISLVNGFSVDSIFIANLVLTDPNAVLEGADLFAKIKPGGPDDDGIDVFLPLDGSKGPQGYSLAYERDRLFAGQLEVFIVVPTPGAAGVLGIAGLAAIRRRR